MKWNTQIIKIIQIVFRNFKTIFNEISAPNLVIWIYL